MAQAARTDPRFADWRYFRFDIDPADLPHALDLLHAKHFRGVNLTVPHKVIAFDRVAAIDDSARPVGAVNTLRWSETGWEGFNTDGYGLESGVHATLGRASPARISSCSAPAEQPVAPPCNVSRNTAHLSGS